MMLKKVKSSVDAKFKQSFGLYCVLKEMSVLRISTNKCLCFEIKDGVWLRSVKI